MAKNLFFLGLIIAASGFVPPPIALLGGLVYGFAVEHPFPAESRRLSKFLLQASVIALGFGMNLHQVFTAGRSGFLYTALSITLTMLLGLTLGRLFGVGKTPAFLISAGTAICGGSAIAAIGPVANANEEEMAVSLGAVFILNSVALFLIPWLGFHFGMTQEQFGLWSALAIHDNSSVVGDAARYGAAASRSCFCAVPSPWHNRHGGYSISDRDGARQDGSQKSWLSAAASGTCFMADCGRDHTVLHSMALD